MAVPDRRRGRSGGVPSDRLSVGRYTTWVTGTVVLALVGFVAAGSLAVSYLRGPQPSGMPVAVGCAAVAAVAGWWLFWQVPVQVVVPAGRWRRRRLDDLAGIAVDRSRHLRPVGMTTAEMVARTNTLLSALADVPGVRIIPSVHPTGTQGSVASHAVSGGRTLVLLEPVALPPGAYQMDATGKVRCDGQYIGQTTHALSAAVDICRALLPRSHRVSALVVVHPTVEGIYSLPVATTEVGWVLAERLVEELCVRLNRRSYLESPHTIAAFTSDPTGW